MAERLKEVAERAGVSTATVSRFLSGRRVRPALQAAIEAALTEKEYEPNLLARRLASRSSTVLGLVVPDIGNPFFLRLAEHIENLAWRAGYRVIVCNSNEDPEREARYVALLKEERVAGLIVAPAVPVGPILPRPGQGLPVVFFDRCPDSIPFDTVMLDNEGASRALVGALFDAGHRRPVGLFTDAPVVGAQRHRGFTAAVGALGLPVRTLRAGHGSAAQHEAVRNALRQWPDMDALVAGNSPMMFAAASVLKETGHPATLAGFDQAEWLTLLDRPAYWVEQPIEEIAHAVVALAVERDGEGGPRHLVFGGQVVSRQLQALAGC